jgi:hypothetical protein
MDDASKISELAALGKADGEKHLEMVVQEFLTRPAPPPKFFT